MTANLLQDLGRHAEAVGKYEEAIAEEPKFFLPYARILNSLRELGSSSYEHWLEVGIRQVPDSPELARLYCLHLLRESRIEELADADWIDRLQSGAGRTDMIGRSSDDPQYIVEAQLFRAVALAARDRNKDILIDAVETLCSSDSRWHLCDVAKLLAASSANLGAVPEADAAYSRICTTCRSERIGTAGSRFTILARANLNAGQLTDAEEASARAIADEPDSPVALWDRWWILDDLDRVEEAVSVADRLCELTPDDVHLHYDLGYMCGKIGRFGKARHHYAEAIRCDSSNWRAHENRSFVEILASNLGDAQRCFDSYEECFRREHEHTAEEAEEAWLLTPEGAISVEQHLIAKQAKFARLLELASEREGRADYAASLVEANESDAPIIGSVTRMGTNAYTFKQIVAMLTGGQPDSDDAKFLLDMEARGDRSHVVASLRAELSAWERFPAEARAALIEGEARTREARSTDSSPEAVCFAKAVEICLMKLVFQPFATSLAQREDSDELHSEMESAKKKQLGRLIGFLTKGVPIGLGDMAFVLSMTGGRTAKSVRVLSILRDFVATTCGDTALFEKTELDEIQRLANDYRNPAAHRETISQSRAQDARKIAFRALSHFGSQ